jgi:hypothetical protein
MSDLETSNLDRFFEMLDEVNIPKTDNYYGYLHPMLLDYWSIHENKDIYKKLKMDTHLVKRCFLYLKQIKYLHRDVEKYSILMNKYKKISNDQKVELSTLKSKYLTLIQKVKNYENEKKKTYLPIKKYSRIYEKQFIIDILEDHWNEFKSKKICYNYTNNYILSSNALKQVTKSVLGFLNAEGGNVYIGIEDNGLVTGILFENREHIDMFIKQVDSILMNIKPFILEKWYDWDYWKIGDYSVVIVIKINKQKDKIKYTINGNKKIYIRHHTLTKSILL